MPSFKTREPLFVGLLVNAQIRIIAVDIFGPEQNRQSSLERLFGRNQPCNIAAPTIRKSSIIRHRVPAGVRSNRRLHTGRIGKGDISVNKLRTR